MLVTNVDNIDTQHWTIIDDQCRLNIGMQHWADVDDQCRLNIGIQRVLSFGYYADVGVTLQPVLGRQSGVGGRCWPDTGPIIKSYMESHTTLY